MDSRGTPENERRALCKGALLRLAVSAAAMAAAILTAGKLLGFAAPFLLAFLLARALEPLIRKASGRFLLPRKSVSAVLLTLVFAAIFGVVFRCAHAMLNEAGALAANWEAYWGRISDIITGIENKANSGAELSGAEALLREGMNAAASWLQDSLGGAVERAAEICGSALSRLAAAPVALAAFVLSSFIISAELPRLDRMAGIRFGGAPGGRLEGINDSILALAGGCLKRRLFVFAASFAILSAGLFMMGRQYALLTAFLAAMLEFVPFLGPGSVLAPWALLCFLSCRAEIGLSLAAIYLFIILARTAIKFYLPKQKSVLTPIRLLVSGYAGYVLDGVAGMVWCPVLMFLFVIVCRAGVFRNTLRDVGTVIEDIRARTARDRRTV